MPAGHDGGPPANLPGSRLAAAEHRRLPAEVDARDGRAQGAEGEVSGDRLPRASAAELLGSPEGLASLRRIARQPQRAADGERRQHVRRAPPDARSTTIRGTPVQGSRAGARGHRLPRRRSGLGREGDRAARGGRRGRRGRRRGDLRRASGCRSRSRTASRLQIDDPELDPIWDACARLKLPVFIHTADPQEFFEPIDYKNERWLELSLFAERRYPADRFPNFES